MANGFTMTLKVIQNDLPKVINGMMPQAEAIVAKAAHDIEAQAKTRAPVDTGNLRASIQAMQTGPAAWRVVVGADYGMYVEWGTRFMGAQPFLRPAVDAVRPGFLQALRAVTHP